MKRISSPVNTLTLVPYVVKTDLLGGAGRDHLRYAAELGRLTVPEKRCDPASNMIELAFVRLKCTSAQAGPPLVFLAGGPGISGIDALHWPSFVPWLEAMRQVGDVIMLDQRGTGMSLPRLDCIERWDLPLDQPGSRAEMLRVGQKRARSCFEFWQSNGIDLSGYTTQESADDVDALRQALGVEQINLYGASYGSHLALAIMKRHHVHVSHAIVALVEGLGHTMKLPSNIQKHLEQLSQLVNADSRLHRAIPDLLDLMQLVFDRLDVDPAIVEIVDEKNGERVKVCMGKFDLQLVTASGIGNRNFISNLPARYYAMSKGDFTWLAREVLKRRTAWFDNAMSYVMDCASGISVERAELIQLEASTTLLEDVINLPFPHICAAWDNPDLGPAFRAPFDADIPTLFISGTLDGRTPISNAEEVCKDFSCSHHLVVAGVTHSSSELFSLPAVVHTMETFLQGHAIPDISVELPFEFVLPPIT